MIELLVVMFVITMLLTIGMPTIIKVRTQMKIGACRVTVNIIDKAVSMYHAQHKRYPSLQAMPAELYGQEFEADPSGGVKEVDDGEPGPGYRLQPRGVVYGPWNGVDQLQRTGDYQKGGQNSRVFFKDAFGRPIWYCPYNQEAESEDRRYEDNEFDHEASEVGINLNSIADYAKNQSGAYYRKDYIIMSQGADSKWGLIRGSGNTVIPPTDDITNFIRE
jgi:competence protein ComGC